MGAHHQNGASEFAVKQVTLWARALMMHQLLDWPDEFDEALWPFAVEHDVYIWNHLVHEGYTQTPIELFTGVRLTTNGAILHARVWGCPTYVLHPRLQNSKKLPRWTPRSRLGMYALGLLSRAPCYSGAHFKS